MVSKKIQYFTLIILIMISFQISLFSMSNKHYKENELTVLEKSLNALEYGYGYDYELELHYIYSYSYSKDNLDKKEKAFAEIINNANFKTVIDLYEKILIVQAVTDYKMNQYKAEPRWKYYTFIKTDLYEPLEKYSSLLLKYILKKNPSLAQFFEMKKNSIKIEIVTEYTKKEEILDTF